ncbi:MAG: hypothetical protein ABL890_02960 [Candidatus Peribacteraceae bacterium]
MPTRRLKDELENQPRGVHVMTNADVQEALKQGRAGRIRSTVRTSVALALLLTVSAIGASRFLPRGADQQETIPSETVPLDSHDHKIVPPLQKLPPAPMIGRPESPQPAIAE